MATGYRIGALMKTSGVVLILPANSTKSAAPAAWAALESKLVHTYESRFFLCSARDVARMVGISV